MRLDIKCNVIKYILHPYNANWAWKLSYAYMHNGTFLPHVLHCCILSTWHHNDMSWWLQGGMCDKNASCSSFFQNAMSLTSAHCRWNTLRFHSNHVTLWKMPHGRKWLVFMPKHVWGWVGVKLKWFGQKKLSLNKCAMRRGQEWPFWALPLILGWGGALYDMSTPMGPSWVVP